MRDNLLQRTHMKTITLPVVLYNCETVASYSKEKLEITKALGNMCMSEGQSDLYRSPSSVRAVESRKPRWAGHVDRMGAIRNSY